MIRLPLPIVAGNRDYQQREDELWRMDELLIRSGVEAACMERVIAAEVAAAGANAKPLSDRRCESIQRYARQALRCTVARIYQQREPSVEGSRLSAS